ncbi:MAG: PD40 domain-containing protein, partial [candidate division Zixibacteria bacterium]|nr:PD40 domain-containing protein [candidate division Zixibacteria bacterium]
MLTRTRINCISFFGLLVLATLLFSPALTTAADTDSYQMPPKAIADLADSPRMPVVSLSPNNEWMLLLKYPPLISLEEVAQPELRIGGLRINPCTNGPSRQRYYYELSLTRISDGANEAVTGLPSGSEITSPRWSPDGRKVAFVNRASEGLELWVVDVSSGEAQRLDLPPLNAAYGSPHRWLSDSKRLLVQTVPTDRGAAPAEPVVPTSPIIQENLGRKAPTRTYQDLLENEHDAALFEHYLTSQMVRVTLDGGSHSIGAAGIIRRVSPSPDGKYILLETIHRPFSYTVPAWRFPVKIEVWDLDGNVVYEVADIPLADEIPIAFGSVRTGRREVGWRADADATLCWAEALDGGDAGVEADERDQLLLLPAPFDGNPIPLITLKLRYSNIDWGNDNLAIVSERWWRTRKICGWQVKPGSPETEPKLLMDRSWEDRYNDPGSPLHTRTKQGRTVLLTADNGGTIFLSGAGASPEGDRPFLDEFDLTTLESRRLFRSEAPYYEDPVRLLDADKRLLLTRRESVTEPPNYFVRDIKKGTLRPVTEFPHPTPQLIDVQKELIRYQREDSLDMTATLYLPPGYEVEDGPLPMLMWAYPQEFKSADAAGQVTDSPYRVVRIGSHSPLMWLVHGYAVLNDPTMPIVGEGDEE